VGALEAPVTTSCRDRSETPHARRAAPRSAAARRSDATRAAESLKDLVVEARAAQEARGREARALLKVIERYKAAGGRGCWETGRALAELARSKLYLSLGEKSFGALLARRGLMSRAFAHDLMRIHRCLPRATAEALGPVRAAEWLRLLCARAGPRARTADLVLAAGGEPEVDGRPVREMSVRELAALGRAARARWKGSGADPRAEEAHRAARALEARLRRAGDAHAVVRALRTRRGWRLRADFAVAAAGAAAGADGTFAPSE
jgi:hypothetical protein